MKYTITIYSLSACDLIIWSHIVEQTFFFSPAKGSGGFPLSPLCHYFAPEKLEVDVIYLSRG